jgi:hypothetical protein
MVTELLTFFPSHYGTIGAQDLPVTSLGEPQDHVDERQSTRANLFVDYAEPYRCRNQRRRTVLSRGVTYEYESALRPQVPCVGRQHPWD